ncbi:MAG: anaerobic glycerol-3-phosphate dehydrogenase subunit C [Phycisphaerales bacterium]|nr:MAG: anaerobic glycerol-3-phosphate dehydrogenase subunit C [Phycisphaerales bacterium]
MVKKPDEVAADLRKVLRGDVFSDILHRAAYSTDASIYRIIPTCVVAPRDAVDAAAVVGYAAGENIAVSARGAGSGVAGESLCSGIVFDMSRYMNGILEVTDEGGVAVCGPGVVLSDLNDRLAGHGRTIGPDPSSANRATIGGCVANNATGAHSLQYGYIGDYVEGIEGVLADGRIVEFVNDFEPAEAKDERLGAIAGACLELVSANETVIDKALPQSKRNRSGYNIAGICHEGRIDLARMLAGSEGTLAIFTKIRLRSVPVPAAKGLLQLEFDSLEQMAEAVPLIVETGPAACELMDQSLMALAVDALPQYRDILPVGAAAVLLVEHIGQTQEQVRAGIAKTDAAVGPVASGRRTFLDPEQQARLWKSRMDAGPLLYRKRSRKHPAEFMEDVSVDHRRLREYIEGLGKIGKKYDLAMSFFGHAGDGELHLRPYLDLGEPADVKKMQAIANEVFSLAWSLGGSISGEHADGLVRAGFVRRQYGDEFYRLLCGIKNIFDPNGLMNPGKIINSDPEVMVKNLRRAARVLPERAKGELFFDKDELGLELEQCYGCGLCLSRQSDLRMCPVFRAMRDEMASSRAKANILNFWATGGFGDKTFASAEFRKFLDLCVNCKACRLECPSGVDISMLMSAARAEYVKRKDLRKTEWLLSNNRFLSRFGSLFASISNFFLRLPVVRWALEQSTGLDQRRAMPAFGRGTFLKAGRKRLQRSAPVAKPLDRVAYFVDTYANYNDHELGFAVLEVLRHNDIEAILPKQLPAPLPSIVYGDFKRAKSDLAYSVRRLASAVREGYKIVCSEPSAALCLKDELRHYVQGEDARLVAGNTHELMNYLLELHGEGKLKPASRTIAERYVYHMPCHLCAVGSGTASIELLEKLGGVEIADLKAGCCGLSGTFGMQKKNHELSAKMSESLKRALESAATKNVLTECAACAMQIEHISECKATHPIKVIAELYKGG